MCSVTLLLPQGMRVDSTRALPSTVSSLHLEMWASLMLFLLRRYPEKEAQRRTKPYGQSFMKCKVILPRWSFKDSDICHGKKQQEYKI